jgi:glutathione peroxidase-family protein
MRLEPPAITTEEAELRAWLRRFSTDRPRWGWRRAAKMARRAGWAVNNKRIRRNFEKFLIGKDGQVVARFAPSTSPDDPALVGAIDAALAK